MQQNNYGKNDATAVARIKALYKELKLEAVSALPSPGVTYSVVLQQQQPVSLWWLLLLTPGLSRIRSPVVREAGHCHQAGQAYAPRRVRRASQEDLQALQVEL